MVTNKIAPQSGVGSNDGVASGILGALVVRELVRCNYINGVWSISAVFNGIGAILIVFTTVK